MLCGSQHNVCNEEGKINDLPLNRAIRDADTGDIADIIAGTFFIAGDTGDGDLCSLTQEQLEHFSQRFAQPETFQPGEVEDALRFSFYSM